MNKLADTSSVENREFSFPIGSSLNKHGVNFYLFSRNCDSVDLLLFENIEDIAPSRIINLDPLANRTYYYRHIFVPGIKKGQLHGYRIKCLYSMTKLIELK